MASNLQSERWGDGPRVRSIGVIREPTARITQQFRERHNMTYEMDCSGVPLVLRVFFPASDAAGENWKIEVSTGHTQPASFATASASSKAQALQHIAQNWRDTMPASISNIDWNGIAQAMTSVRAL